MPQYQLPRGTFPANYGDLLRANQLGEGLSWGGSELNARDDISQDQIARALGLAVNPPAASPAAPVISNADIARFMAQQNGGELPGLPQGGSDDAPGPGATVGAPPGGGIPGASNVGGTGSPGGTGSISNLGNLPDVTAVGEPSAISQALSAAVNGINSPIGQTALDLASATGFGGIPALAVRTAARLAPVFGLGGAPKDSGPVGQTVDALNESLSGSFRGSDPKAQQEFAAQRSGERAPEVTVTPPDVNEPREDAPPAAPPSAPPDNPPDAPDTSGPPGVPGEESGTGVGGGPGPGAGQGNPSGEGPSAPGPGPSGPGPGPSGPGPSGGGGSSGDSGEGDEKRGGFLGARRGQQLNRANRPGGFKNAPKFSSGGPVNERQARLDRIRSFESKHGKMAI